MDIQKTCLWCGKPFIAHKMTTLYCCHRCNSFAYKDAKRKEKIAQFEASEQKKPRLVVEHVGNKPYLSPTDVALLLGVSRVSVYRYMASGILKALQLKGRTRIRRSDVERLFDDSSEYLKRGRFIEKDSTKYTIDAIAEKYHILRKTVKSKCNAYGIPAVTIKRRVLYDKVLVDEKFSELLEPLAIDSYYTADQIAEKYGMSYNAVLSFVNRHKFPRVKKHQTVFYSKFAVDEYKGSGIKVNTEYYTYSEIEKKYGFNKTNISYYVNTYKIKSEKKGRINYVLRESFDQAIREHKDGIKQNTEPLKSEVMPDLKVFQEIEEETIPEGYWDADRIADEYKVRRPHVWKVTRKNNIPKIIIKGINYYESKSVELFFAKYKAKDNVEEWISATDMEKIYNMTPDARKHFASRHNIPSKIIFGKAYYSKDDIEKVKNNQFKNYENYYSIQEAMAKYNLKREDVYGIVRYKDIKKYKYGKQVFILKSDFDIVMEQKGSKKKDNS